jgi:hypothetical protein
VEKFLSRSLCAARRDEHEGIIYLFISYYFRYGQITLVYIYQKKIINLFLTFHLVSTGYGNGVQKRTTASPCGATGNVVFER